MILQFAEKYRNDNVFNFQVETEFSGAGNSNFSSLDPENRLKLVGLSALGSILQNYISAKNFLDKFSSYNFGQSFAKSVHYG
jgi:hypothetical protein